MNIRLVTKTAWLFCMLITGFTRSTAQESAIQGDSITIAVAPAYDQVSGFHRFWLGNGYRKLWAAPVKMKVLNLQKEKGGLVILQKGGGLQTKSLRLKDAAGREWVLRSIEKYPELGLPPKLRNTIARDILQDQIITGHPYSALTVPTFAEALGISHSNPQIVYVPDDPLLGEYRKEFGKSVLLFEERQPIDTVKTDNTEKAQAKLEDDNDVTVDQNMILRARLLDILLGDWDRHEDQWRWEKRQVGNVTAYSPVPRDRDKVYYNTTGFLPWVLAKQNLKANLEGFTEDINNIHSYNYNNRYFDRYFLNRLTREDWEREASFVQSTITDDLIEKAIRKMPDTIYALSGAKIIQVLKARRAKLLTQSLNYYNAISKYVDVPGTSKHERFEIIHKENGKVQVTIHKVKKIQPANDVIYSREFDPEVTKEIRLYGMDGQDVFAVSGNTPSSIKLRLIGGDGRDSFFVDANSASKRKIFVYDRSDEENILPLVNVRDRSSTDTVVNSFNRKSFVYEHIQPIIGIKFNRDLGAQLKLGFLKKKQGFRKQPYAKKEMLWGSYSTARNSYMFSYFADHKKLIGKNDLVTNLLSMGPHNVSNFFGTGNETNLVKSPGRDEIAFYRNRYDLVTADIRMRGAISKNASMNVGLIGQYYRSAEKNNSGKLLETYNMARPGENVFSNSYYGGLVAGLEIDSRNDALLIYKGIRSYTELRGMQQFSGPKETLGKIETELSFYIPLKDSVIVLANHFGGGTTFGSPAFFQQMRLGGEQNLRGYYNDRFTGRSSAYYNAELRMKLFDFTSYIAPGSFGIVGFHDIGRVWSKGETSDTWHTGYGGGIYLIPADIILFQAGLAHSKEGNQPYFLFGFRF